MVETYVITLLYIIGLVVLNLKLKNQKYRRVISTVFLIAFGYPLSFLWRIILEITN
ncbi:hypothetical protein [Gottfriedia acidiceleris]|uniref:hypothetical protein n=1 Tax=Gottfriedia acidiceleris TaxID=371036 RepID=UPI0030003484